MRIVAIDDHTLFRQGMKYLLEGLSVEHEYIEFGDLESAVEEQLEDVELILLDYHLPGRFGLEALADLRQRYESATIVVLSSEHDAKIVRACVDAGAAGFIPKSSDQEVLIAALKLVLAGGVYLPTEILSGTSTESSRPEGASQPLAELSDRQREVLQELILGKPNKVIARELDISGATVKAHLSACFRALGVSNRTEAVYVAASLGLHRQ